MRTHFAVIKHKTWVTSGGVFYFAQTICSLCLKSKESCIQKSFVGRNMFVFGLKLSCFCLVFGYFWSEVMYVTL